jgi:hypothetical protein
MSKEPTKLEYYRGLVRTADDESSEKRAARLERISTLTVSSFSTLRIIDFYEESKVTFVNACFRSCIISSALAVEQLLKHILISISEEWEETYWEIEMKNLTYNQIISRIQECKIVDKGLFDDAHWLRRVRNQIAAHPMFIGNYFDVDEHNYLILKQPEEVFWANRVMFRDVKKLLRFVDPEKRKEFEEMKVGKKEKIADGVWEAKPLKDYLKQQKFDLGNFLLWVSLEHEILEELAFEAFRRMVKIINILLPKLNNSQK